MEGQFALRCYDVDGLMMFLKKFRMWNDALNSGEYTMEHGYTDEECIDFLADNYLFKNRRENFQDLFFNSMWTFKSDLDDTLYLKVVDVKVRSPEESKLKDVRIFIKKNGTMSIYFKTEICMFDLMIAIFKCNVPFKTCLENVSSSSQPRDPSDSIYFEDDWKFVRKKEDGPYTHQMFKGDNKWYPYFFLPRSGVDSLKTILSKEFDENAIPDGPDRNRYEVMYREYQRRHGSRSL